MGDSSGPVPYLSEEENAPEAAVGSLSTPGAPVDPAEEVADSMNQPYQYVKDYRDSPQDFDRMLITIWHYFELINQNSAKIEDLWLNILEVL